MNMRLNSLKCNGEIFIFNSPKLFSHAPSVINEALKKA